MSLTNRRLMLFGLSVVAGTAFIVSSSAAAPINGPAIGASAHRADLVTDIADGCGRDRHRNRYGSCVSSYTGKSYRSQPYPNR